jgi:hypothetical protein
VSNISYIEKVSVLCSQTNPETVMIKENCSRRTFLAAGAKAGMACCLMAAGPRLMAMTSDRKTPDPSKLCYCGYDCPRDCKFLKATRKNDDSLKKEAFEEWTLEERYGVTFDPQTAVCYGCKDMEHTQGVVVSNCSVRRCAREKELECCIQCEELAECDKALWQRFPGFHETVIEMREKYLAAK